MSRTPRPKRVPEKDEIIIAEAALVEDPDLALHTRSGFRHVDPGELVLTYLVRDYERYTLEDDGSVAILYMGRRYDAGTLEPKGPPKRSGDSEDLRQWWHKVTGSPSSSKILVSSGNSDPSNG